MKPGIAFVVALGALVGTSHALADDDPLAGIYGNVLTVHNESTGDTSTFLFRADHSATVIVGSAEQPRRVGALWGFSEDGVAVCVQPSPIGGIPIPETAPQCMPLSGHIVGDQWTTVNDAQQTLDLSLTAMP